ncbi:hypothetical protein DFH28DRAFT_1118679 [Melampsora americana]|nr:hypothetical protein DFH28DRAFT_1118679 [Melampsora americana]
MSKQGVKGCERCFHPRMHLRAWLRIHCEDTSTSILGSGPRFKCPRGVESFEIDWSDLDCLTVKPNSLPRLRQFSFTAYPDNILSLAWICQAVKDSLKVIDISSGDRGQGDVQRIFIPIKAKLEEWPMLQNVRTIVTPLPERYWRKALKVAGAKVFEKAPDLKHIVFTKSGVKIDPRLLKALKLCGVQGHCRPKLSTDKIMELDSKLNNPLYGFQSLN